MPSLISVMSLFEFISYFVFSPAQVWLYLLGHYEIAMTTEEQQARDASSREQYERIMSEWMAVEAIVRQREAETQANVKVTSESQDIGGPAGQFMLQHKDSTLSNEVFESLDSDTDYLPRQSTVAEESCSAVTSPEDASHMSVSFHTGAATTDCNATNTTTNVVSGGSTLATEQDADVADQALQKEIDGDGNEEVGQVTTRNRTPDLRNIIVTDASIDHGDLLPPPVLPNVLELRLTPLAERNGMYSVLVLLLLNFNKYCNYVHVFFAILSDSNKGIFECF